MNALDGISRLRRSTSDPGEWPERVGLVAIDLDGTMLSPAGHVSARTRSAIRAVTTAGIAICIATGRSWWESRDAIAEAELAGPGVFVGGAIVSDLASGTTLARTLMQPDVAREICHELNAIGIAAMALQDRSDADVEWLIAAEHDMPHSVPEWLARHGSSFRREPDLKRAAHERTVRVGTVTKTREAAERIAAWLAKHIGGDVYQHLITVAATGVTVLEVFDASVNKWSGIRQVAAMLAINEQSVIAIGDDANDLHMLQHARVGIAMGNARADVRAVADRVIASNADDGLAEYLESLLAAGGRLPPAK